MTSVSIDANTANSETALSALLSELAQAAAGAGNNAKFGGMRVYGITVDYDQIPPDTPAHIALRDAAKDVPTSWTLTPAQLQVTEEAARFLLRNHPCYAALVADLKAAGPVAATDELSAIPPPPPRETPGQTAAIPPPPPPPRESAGQTPLVVRGNTAVMSSPPREMAGQMAAIPCTTMIDIRKAKELPRRGGALPASPRYTHAEIRAAGDDLIERRAVVQLENNDLADVRRPLSPAHHDIAAPRAAQTYRQAARTSRGTLISAP